MPTIGEDEKADTSDDENAAIDSPLRLASHEAAWKDVDSLQKPDAARKQTQTSQDIQQNPHGDVRRPGVRLTLGFTCSAP
jgi:hypothetical protein